MVNCVIHLLLKTKLTTKHTMNNNNNFTADLATGQQAERDFATVVQREFNATDIKFNTSLDVSELRKWDLSYCNRSGNRLTFEIKHDLLSTTTGNFAVEFFGRYAASGIDATTADYWTILSGDKFYIFKTTQLKELIKRNNFRSLRINNGSAYCYLIPISEAQKIAKVVLVKPLQYA